MNYCMYSAGSTRSARLFTAQAALWTRHTPTGSVAYLPPPVLAKGCRTAPVIHRFFMFRQAGLLGAVICTARPSGHYCRTSQFSRCSFDGTTAFFMRTGSCRPCFRGQGCTPFPQNTKAARIPGLPLLLKTSISASRKNGGRGNSLFGKRASLFPHTRCAD